MSENCSGCGGPLKEVGALAVFATRCCGAQPYALCVTCAGVMTSGGEKQRTELVANIELSLAVNTGSPQ